MNQQAHSVRELCVLQNTVDYKVFFAFLFWLLQNTVDYKVFGVILFWMLQNTVGYKVFGVILFELLQNTVDYKVCGVFHLSETIGPSVRFKPNRTDGRIGSDMSKTPQTL